MGTVLNKRHYTFKGNTNVTKGWPLSQDCDIWLHQLVLWQGTQHGQAAGLTAPWTESRSRCSCGSSVTSPGRPSCLTGSTSSNCPQVRLITLSIAGLGYCPQVRLIALSIAGLGYSTFQMDMWWNFRSLTFRDLPYWETLFIDFLFFYLFLTNILFCNWPKYTLFKGLLPHWLINARVGGFL